MSQQPPDYEDIPDESITIDLDEMSPEAREKWEQADKAYQWKKTQMALQNAEMRDERRRKQFAVHVKLAMMLLAAAALHTMFRGGLALATVSIAVGIWMTLMWRYAYLRPEAEAIRESMFKKESGVSKSGE